MHIYTHFYLWFVNGTFSTRCLLVVVTFLTCRNTLNTTGTRDEHVERTLSPRWKVVSLAFGHYQRMPTNTYHVSNDWGTPKLWWQLIIDRWLNIQNVLQKYQITRRCCYNTLNIFPKSWFDKHPIAYTWGRVMWCFGNLNSDALCSA